MSNENECACFASIVKINQVVVPEGNAASGWDICVVAEWGQNSDACERENWPVFRQNGVRSAPHTGKL